jgi:uncharacterized protein (DUF1778 family)
MRTIVAQAKDPHRISFRIDARNKRLIEEAAISSGLTLTDYAIAVLVERSRAILRDTKVRELSARDTAIFLRMLNRCAAPNTALKKAARRCKRCR